MYVKFQAVYQCKVQCLEPELPLQGVVLNCSLRQQDRQ